MNMKCNKCNKEAIIFQKYSGMHLCKKHFIEDVERKIKFTIRKHFNIQKNDIIAIALSGGKDSAVLLYMLHKLFDKRPDIELIAITIDEGIEGYREHTLKIAKELTAKLGVKHIIRSFKDEFDTPLDDIIAQEREKGACSYCGVLRKTLLNK
ncbi:MAG: ATP-binding protein, partial [Methanosarcinaceae archaeon]|nr:ATP-binding protein [Methanosarcinaceae archaeon]